MPDKELPESVQAAMGYMQELITRLEADEPLTPRQRHLVAQAATYAEADDYDSEHPVMTEEITHER